MVIVDVADIMPFEIENEDRHFSLQQQNALNRMNIVPEALLFEAPRPRTDDVKPGMSNIKVKHFALALSAN